MRRALSVGAVVLVLVGAVVVAGELAEPTYEAAASGGNSTRPGVFVTNDVVSPVPVAEQGTVNVNVVNSNLPVQVVEGRVPYQRAVNALEFGPERFKAFHFDVPDGKLLVVETVTATAIIEEGQKLRGELNYQGSGLGNSEFGVAAHVVKLDHVPGFGPGDYFEGTQAIQGYAAGEQGVIFQFFRNSDTGVGGRCEFSVSGYLVDLPAEGAL